MSEPPWLESSTQSRKRLSFTQGGPLLILAGAGSGKTRVITTKIAYLVDRRA